jgi:hypothetical protein
MTRAHCYHSVALLIALPLALSLSQNSACRSSGTNSGNSSMNTNSTVVTDIQNPDLRGTWGGQHIAMEIKDAEAVLEFDCAHGRITENITPDREGKFEAKGVYAAEHGGPVRQGESNEQPATYRGSIKDQTMTLTIELTRNNEKVGTFTLTHGSEGRVHKCL